MIDLSAPEARQHLADNLVQALEAVDLLFDCLQLEADHWAGEITPGKILDGVASGRVKPLIEAKRANLKAHIRRNARV